MIEEKTTLGLVYSDDDVTHHLQLGISLSLLGV